MTDQARRGEVAPRRR